MELPGPTREQGMSRAGLILALYGALSLGALLLSAGRGDVDLYRSDGATPLLLALSPLIGLLIGLVFVVSTRYAVYRYDWARRLHRDFRDILGPLTGREIAILALASAVGEELLFRGALMPWLGLWPQAILFALLHIGPGARFWVWTASALAIGVLFGYLATWTGNLGAPIAAHFVINFLNLHFIARTDLPAPPERRRPEPSPLEPT